MYPNPLWWQHRSQQKAGGGKDGKPLHRYPGEAAAPAPQANSGSGGRGTGGQQTAGWSASRWYSSATNTAAATATSEPTPDTDQQSAGYAAAAT